MSEKGTCSRLLVIDGIKYAVLARLGIGDDPSAIVPVGARLTVDCPFISTYKFYFRCLFVWAFGAAVGMPERWPIE